MAEQNTQTSALTKLVRTWVDAWLPVTCVLCSAACPDPVCAACVGTFAPALPERPALFHYGATAPLKLAVVGAKNGDVLMAEALGWLLATRLDVEGLDAVTFVPTPFVRRAIRGFDLPAVLARCVATTHGLPLVDALKLTRHDAAFSSGKSRAERLQGVVGRYLARPLAPQRLLLIDDVVTTGATLGEASRILITAGHEVSVQALASAD